VARMGEERGAYRVLVGKPEGKRLLGRPRRRWVDNVMWRSGCQVRTPIPCTNLFIKGFLVINIL